MLPENVEHVQGYGHPSLFSKFVLHSHTVLAHSVEHSKNEFGVTGVLDNHGSDQLSTTEWTPTFRISEVMYLTLPVPIAISSLRMCEH